MRILGGRVERRLVGRGIVVADRDARLHRVRRKAIVDELQGRDMRRILDRLVNSLAVVFNEAPVVAKIGPNIVVNQLAACERSAHVYDCGKLLDFDIDRFRCIPCLFKRLRDDRRDRVADMPDFALGEHRMGRLLHRLSIAVRNQPAAGKPPDAFEVLAREDGQNSRHCFRLRRVDRLQRAVRDFRSQKICVSLAADVEIVRVPPVSSQETHVFAALAASADTAIFRHCLLRSFVFGFFAY